MEIKQEFFEIFDRSEFTFKQLKQLYTEQELAMIKAEYKAVWEKWKAINLNVSTELAKKTDFAKPKIESWTNGWNLRNHFWAAYRSKDKADHNACIGVLLNRKQLQVYLMFQHYQSEKRQGTNEEYNHLLTKLDSWTQGKNVSDYHIWPKQEHELQQHQLLKDYLQNEANQEIMQETIQQTSFQLGKIIYRNTPIPDAEQTILQAIDELEELYRLL